MGAYSHMLLNHSTTRQHACGAGRFQHVTKYKVKAEINEQRLHTVWCEHRLITVRQLTHTRRPASRESGISHTHTLTGKELLLKRNNENQRNTAWKWRCVCVCPPRHTCESINILHFVFFGCSLSSVSNNALLLASLAPVWICCCAVRHGGRRSGSRHVWPFLAARLRSLGDYEPKTPSFVSPAVL